MEVVLKEVYNKPGEMFYYIIKPENSEILGLIFSIGNSVAYEVMEQYRGHGIATQALIAFSKKLKKPRLEIKFDNFSSKKVAQNSGYILVKIEYPFEIYEINLSSLDSLEHNYNK